MVEYSHDFLRSLAKSAGLWIDVHDREIPRGAESENTNKKERVSRALSWYARAESEETADGKLIFSFIALNALYSQNGVMDDGVSRGEFWKKIQKSEHSTPLFEFAIENEKQMIEIISFHYLSTVYWNDIGQWPEKIGKMKKQAAVAKNATPEQIRNGKIKPLQIAVERIYLLRNQVMHGMAAYKDSYNRTQVGKCAWFLYSVVERIIELVINDAGQNWGKISYPPQGVPDKPDIDVLELKD